MSNTYTQHFVATNIDYVEEEEVYILAIADDDEAPENFLLLLYPKRSGGRKHMGEKRYQEYFRSSCTNGGNYGMVHAITIHDDTILVQLRGEDYTLTIMVSVLGWPESADALHEWLHKTHKAVQSPISLQREAGAV